MWTVICKSYFQQHVALPKTGPSDDSTYMYSAVHNNDLEDLEGDSSNNIPQEPRKILPGFLYTGTKQVRSLIFIESIATFDKGFCVLESILI